MTPSGSGDQQLLSEAGAAMEAQPGEQPAAQVLALPLDQWRDRARAAEPPN